MRENNCFTSERNAQILIYLMKAHGIKKIVASPGTTNIALVYSMQHDDYFEMYSAADERSAAYIACGLAAESGEAVALTCTGATASRNYTSGLTEAYYRKLPVLAITSTQYEGRIGHNMPQVVDRRVIQNDIATLSVNIPIIQNKEDEWDCEIKMNQALLELKHHGGGPVHINLTTNYSKDFSIVQLPQARVINRITQKDFLPKFKDGRIGVFVGAHSKWDKEYEEVVNAFCKKYNAVVLCDHTSNYKGEYRVLATAIMKRKNAGGHLNNFDTIIHIGNVSGGYLPKFANLKEVWRVNPDGKLCDTFRKLKYVFEMDELDFFSKYVKEPSDITYDRHLIEEWKEEYSNYTKNIPELPFSNIWVAYKTSDKLPGNSILHLGILNSLRSWNYFEVPKNVLGYSNTGGFGIDGCVSTLIGASKANSDKLYYGIVGDLAFFYDMNSIANHHVGPNVRLMVITNGGGAEFKLNTHMAYAFGKEADKYIAASGHYGNKSKNIIKNYAESLGFEYYGASSKAEYLDILPKFVNETITDRPMLVEIFTDYEREDEALELIRSNCNVDDNAYKTVEKSVKVPKIYKEYADKNIIIWGAGNCFVRNFGKVRNIAEIKYVCDNNPDKWGKEMITGIKCISPQELQEMDNVFVIIMIENISIAFQVVNQLMDMGITSYDYYNNLISYKE